MIATRESHNMFYVWCTVAAVVSFFGSLAACGYILLKLPTNYFVEHSKPKLAWPTDAKGWTLRIGKNVVGVAILAAGITMLFTPGQGVLAILLGLMLFDFPGKHALVRRLLQSGKVLTAANRWRAKFDKPPLEAPPHDGT